MTLSATIIASLSLCLVVCLVALLYSCRSANEGYDLLQAMNTKYRDLRDRTLLLKHYLSDIMVRYVARDTLAINAYPCFPERAAADHDINTLAEFFDEDWAIDVDRRAAKEVTRITELIGGEPVEGEEWSDSDVLNVTVDDLAGGEEGSSISIAVDSDSSSADEPLPVFPGWRL